MPNSKPALLACAVAGIWRSLRFGRAALSHASASLIVVAALLGLARTAPVYLSPLVRGSGYPVETLYRLIPSELLAACMLIAVLLAEQFVRRGVRRLTAYLPAVAVAAMISGLICAPLILFMSKHGIPMNIPYEKFGPLGTGLFYCADALARGGLAAFVYANRESLLASMRELRSAQLDRARAERDLVSSRLVAVEAMMKPEALVSALKALRTLYEEDSSAADLKLAAFIEQLRAITLAIRA
jgi:hypothetical protein